MEAANNMSDLHGAYVWSYGKLYGRLSVNRPYVFLCTDDIGFRGTETREKFGYRYSYSFCGSETRNFEYVIRYLKNNYGLLATTNDRVTLYDLIPK